MTEKGPDTFTKLATKRHQKTERTIALLERKVPFFARLNRNPSVRRWMPTIVTSLEVAASLLLLFLFPKIIALIPFPDIDIPFPEIRLPDIPFPKIPLPSFSLPVLPEWLRTVLYWIQKTWPIWIAVAIAIIGWLKRDRERGAGNKSSK